eukprot:gnl/TRDRNA2_/TRDRNA2_72504_c0_seq1.p1 gnl/TRDRNA2_/TRDRNA2_72504_c0~~gnl/TRDRNA2_/TRDRNA2_72504_c0_seq1.p1  ORF type:complete len:436 (-),score=87.14 gnl/TRDRNA2_/TRDRNA2_72504_c0_seq1:85-1392(-)
MISSSFQAADRSTDYLADMLRQPVLQAPNNFLGMHQFAQGPGVLPEASTGSYMPSGFPGCAKAVFPPAAFQGAQNGLNIHAQTFTPGFAPMERYHGVSMPDGFVNYGDQPRACPRFFCNEDEQEDEEETVAPASDAQSLVPAVSSRSNSDDECHGRRYSAGVSSTTGAERPEDLERALEPYLPGMGNDPTEDMIIIDREEGKKRGCELLSMLSDFGFGGDLKISAAPACEGIAAEIGTGQASQTRAEPQRRCLQNRSLQKKTPAPAPEPSEPPRGHEPPKPAEEIPQPAPSPEVEPDSRSSPTTTSTGGGAFSSFAAAVLPPPPPPAVKPAASSGGRQGPPPPPPPPPAAKITTTGPEPTAKTITVPPPPPPAVTSIPMPMLGSKSASQSLDYPKQNSSRSYGRQAMPQSTSYAKNPHGARGYGRVVPPRGQHVS